MRNLNRCHLIVVLMMRFGRLRVKSEVVKVWGSGAWRTPDLMLSCNDNTFPNNKYDKYDWNKGEDDDIEC